MAYWVLKAILTPVLYLFERVRVEGREHVPRTGPAILAANHQSFCDSFFLPLVIRRRVTYVAKAEYFDDWKMAWFFKAAGQIPMHRGGGDRSQRALDTATHVLRDGDLLGIYPEGTRAPDDHLYKGKTGVARLAATCGVPVVPVGMSGTRAVQPPGRRMLRPFHSVTVRFGEPLTVGVGTAANGDADVPDAHELRVFTDQLMAAIADLSGQEYRDLYAAEAKAGGPSKLADNGAPGTAAARALRERLHRPLVTGRKPPVHPRGLA